MPAPVTKVEIANRVQDLNALVHARRATLVSQQDERRELVDSCHVHGGHVPAARFEHGLAAAQERLFYACEFCSHPMSAPRQQIARALLVG